MRLSKYFKLKKNKFLVTFILFLCFDSFSFFLLTFKRYEIFKLHIFLRFITILIRKINSNSGWYIEKVKEILLKNSHL